MTSSERTVKFRLCARLLQCFVLPCVLLSACTVLEYPRRWPDAPPIPVLAPGQQPSAPPEVPEPVVTSRPPRTPIKAVEPDAQDVGEVLSLARQLVGARGPLTVQERSFPYDCSGYVCAIYYQVGEELLANAEGLSVPAPAPEGTPSGIDHSQENMSGTEIIFRKLSKEGQIFKKNPRPGDLVFFDDTWDRNGDGQLNDPFTHIAVVDQVLSDGTLQLLHLGNSGIAPLLMNLERPRENRDPASGQVLNDRLRRRTNRDPDGTPYLTAECFRAFGRPLP